MNSVLTITLSALLEGLIGTCICAVGIPLVIIALLFSGGQKRREQVQAEHQSHLRTLDLSRVDIMSGHQFEHYVAALLENEGFTVVEVTQGSGDFGVDIVAWLEETRYAIQVKRHGSKVSRRAISDAVAGMKHYDCTAAMVVTNSYFSDQARAFATSVGCRLIDRDELGEWIKRNQESSLNHKLQG